MVLVDLRNHGKSAEIAGLSLPHSIGSAARDLADLVNARGWDLPAVVIVHSMGYKMALDLAESFGCGDYAEHVRFPKQINHEANYFLPTSSSSQSPKLVLLLIGNKHGGNMERKGQTEGSD